MFRSHVILAVAKRNFRSYFSGLLGYLFIVVFCVSAAAFAFGEGFFAANQANLDQLTNRFLGLPLLLLFVIPAITMSTWADERKLGTDELLFSMPAQEIEVLIGKYLAVLGVYTAALAFSLVNVIVLCWLGDPEIGTLVSTYLAYWLAGASLLSAGMLASALTNNTTVAFVLGVLFCGIPLVTQYAPDFMESMVGLLGVQWDLTSVREALLAMSLQQQLPDFSMGVVSLYGVFWFVLITALMLYLNLVVISRRRWAAGQSGSMGLQYAIRAICILVIGCSLLKIFWHYPVRADFSSEKLFTLSAATRDTLDSLAKGNKITIQSFISPDVPADYVETRRQLLGLLKEYQLSSSGAIEWTNRDAAPFSDAAETARILGIEPLRVLDSRGGRQQVTEFFLGVFIQSTGASGDELVIPAFGKGLPIEYELTRSLRTVSQKSRLKVGVLLTDARPMSEGEGGGEWDIIRELKKQYEVVAVNPAQPILESETSAETPDANDASKSEDGEDKKDAENKDSNKKKKKPIDVLVAIMPSSLNEMQMQHFVDYVKAGKPTLIFDDPCPVAVPPNGLGGAPRQPKPSPGGMFGGGPPPEQKADGGEATALMNALGIRWNHSRIAFDPNNPHSEFGNLPPEYVFVSHTANEPSPFGADSPISSHLQDVVLLYPGTIEDKAARSDQKFIPLLRTSRQGGLLEWEEFTSQSFTMAGPSVDLKQEPNRRKVKTRESYVLAAAIRNESKETPLNVVFCSDADMVTDMFFRIRSQGDLNVEFDNVTFVLNAVDALAGENTFIDLRSRREKLRTLTLIEQKTSAMRGQLTAVEKEGQEKMDERLKKAQDELEAEISKLEENKELDDTSRVVQIQQKQQQLNRKLSVEKEELERQLRAKVRKSELEMNRGIRQVEEQTYYWACFFAVILPGCFGMLFLGLRNLAEQQSINPNRRKS